MTEIAAPDTREKPLKETLARFLDREALFVEPGGNWGDSLIYLGAESLARRIGLRFKRLTYDEFIVAPPDHERTVYVHGGGGFNFHCSGNAPSAFLFAIGRYRGPVILGPTTVDDAAGFVDAVLLPGLRERIASEIVVYVRERTSLEALAGRLPDDIALYLDDDTALQLTADEALNDRPQASRYVLLALREDNEARPVTLGTKFKGIRLDPASYACSFDHWVRIHSLAARIITNRLHSSIIGTVLNKPTTLLGGNYHKNRSLWEYSLKKRGVAWLEVDAAPEHGHSAAHSLQELPVIGRVARSWKVQRTLKRLAGVPSE
jgi:exopolysaccharide biosynthesis predicted pyruvyltransferase EpsI